MQNAKCRYNSSLWKHQHDFTTHIIKYRHRYKLKYKNNFNYRSNYNYKYKYKYSGCKRQHVLIPHPYTNKDCQWSFIKTSFIFVFIFAFVHINVIVFVHICIVWDAASGIALINIRAHLLFSLKPHLWSEISKPGPDGVS